MRTTGTGRMNKIRQCWAYILLDNGRRRYCHTNCRKTMRRTSHTRTRYLTRARCENGDGPERMKQKKVEEKDVHLPREVCRRKNGPIRCRIDGARRNRRAGERRREEFAMGRKPPGHGFRKQTAVSGIDISAAGPTCHRLNRKTVCCGMCATWAE